MMFTIILDTPDEKEKFLVQLTALFENLDGNPMEIAPELYILYLQPKKIEVLRMWCDECNGYVSHERGECVYCGTELNEER